MDASFWKTRWQEGRIGFHEGRANALLGRQVARLRGRKRVLVPLCGKAEDMAFLAAHDVHVVGIELVESALDAFFAEHQITPKRSSRGPLKFYEAPNLTLIAGDFFAVTREDVGEVDAFYDRAAIVALPPEMRPRYADHLRKLCANNATGLVIAFEYPQEAMQGPPFSVPEAELRQLYPGATLVQVDERPTNVGKLRDSGVDVTERCYALSFTAA